MSLTFGFYNSQNGDRRYNANQMSGLFDGIIKDGIFGSIGDKFMVSAGSGMTVNVGTGRAWFNQTWTFNDSDMPIVIANSELVLNRIDTIVIDVNKLTRTNSIVVINGTPASEPVAPALINDTNTQHYQYPLCDIYVGVGVTEITQDKITNRVGVDSPFVTGAVQSVSVDDLVAQWDAEFHSWMTTLAGILGDEPASDLAGSILALSEATVHRDGSGAMTGNLNMNSHKVTNVADPVDNADGANKTYVDNKATKVDLLWINASPESVFPKQTLTIPNASKYDAIYVRFRYSTVYGYEQTVFLMSADGGVCYFPVYNHTGASGFSVWMACSRHVTREGDNIKFGKGISIKEDYNWSEDDYICYPAAIYGIKW